jgi:transcriptional regulator with XRE-family HTH domain
VTWADLHPIESLATRGADRTTSLWMGISGCKATEIAELLDVRPETVSRWERGEVDIPRAAAFALGELYEHPHVTKRKLSYPLHEQRSGVSLRETAG